MMEFWNVVALSNGKVVRVVPCSEHALNFVRDELKALYPQVQAVPAESHWSATLIHPTHPHDVDGTGVRW